MKINLNNKVHSECIKKVSFGNYWSKIESLTIQIPNGIDDCRLQSNSKSNNQSVSSIAISISFWLKLITFNLFLIERSIKTSLKLIKTLKLSNLIKKLIYFWLFRCLSITFDINSISFNINRLFDIVWFNRFRHNNYFVFQDFGSKKLIQSQFNRDLSQNFALGRLDRRCLMKGN